MRGWNWKCVWERITLRAISSALNSEPGLHKSFLHMKEEYSKFGYSYFCHSLRSGVNFINFIGTNFSYERCFGSFLLVTYGLVPKFCTKKARKMLMKLTSGVNFINILLEAFMLADSKSAKKIDCLFVFFCDFSICVRKSCL